MAYELLEFMDEALAGGNLLQELETKYNELYDDQGDPIVPDADQQLSDWFDEKGYNISKGQCKKLSPTMSTARGKVIPQY